MVRDNTVIFKGRKDGITVILDGKKEFIFIKDALRRKASDASKFFGGAKASVMFKGRYLSEDEELELLQIIKEHNLDARIIKPEGLAKSESDAAPNPGISSMLAASVENASVFHKGALRSGQAIRYPGSVVVLGDVNPGAEIIAEGNIIILGVLKGMVHAGCKGNTDCFVTAMKMLPTQLRIADIITYIPTDTKKFRKKPVNPLPAYAYIQDGQIYIAPLIN